LLEIRKENVFLFIAGVAGTLYGLTLSGPIKGDFVFLRGEGAKL